MHFLNLIKLRSFIFQIIKKKLKFLNFINVLKIPAVHNDGAGAATVALIDFPEGQKKRFPEGNTSACKVAIVLHLD